MAQLATPEEDRPEEESAYTYISTNTIASSLQQNRKGQPPNLVFLPHESSCLDITLGRFNPYQPKLKEEAMISSSLHKAYGPEPGHGKQVAKKMFSQSPRDWLQGEEVKKALYYATVIFVPNVSVLGWIRGEELTPI